MKKYTFFDVALAVCASAIAPGLGQFFQLKYRRATAFFIGVILGYAVYPPVGFLVHATAIFEACFPNYKNEK